MASVHHTGTTFTMDMLEKNGFKAFQREHPGNYKRNCYYRQHIEQRCLEPLNEALARGYPVIVPLRHPKLCAQSWTKRHKPVDVMLQQWQLLLDVVAPHKPLYLPLDLLDRGEYLERIALSVGVDLWTEWGVLNAKRCTCAMDAEDEAKVDDFVRSAKFKETLGSIY